MTRGTRNQAGRIVPRNKPRPNYWLLFKCLCLSIVLAGTATYALKTPDLTIREVKIYGVKLADRASVERAGKAALGQSILLLRKSPIKDDIRRLCEVKQVKMGRRFPDRVWIRVWERKPDAVLTDGRRLCLIQADGFMFHYARKPIKGLPLIILLDGCHLQPGRKVKVTDTSTRAALEALDCAKHENLKLDKISIDRLGDMCLNMGSAFYVKLGQPDDTGKKLSLLRKALAYKPSLAEDAAYIDLSCPSAPVWKPRVVAQAGY